MSYRPTIPARGDADRPRSRRYRIKADLLAADPRCYWCRVELGWETATLEHRIPRSRGGSDGRRNIVIACRPCNNAKGDMMPHEFWRALAGGAVAIPRREVSC